MSLFEPIDFAAPDFGDFFDELPLWSAPFGLWVLDRVPLSSQQTVLDLGSGTGFLTIELAERCGPGATVIAVDPWSAAMQRLRRKIAQRNLTNIRLLEQDAATITLPDGSVDVILSNLGVNNFDRPADIMRVCRRVAKPGATILLTTNLIGHMSEFYAAYAAVLVRTNQSDRLVKLEAHIQHRATESSLTSLLQEGGFTVDEVVHDSFRLRFATGTALLRHFFIRLGFMPAWKELATPGRENETFVALESELNTMARRLGELSLTIPTAGLIGRRAS